MAEITVRANGGSLWQALKDAGLPTDSATVDKAAKAIGLKDKNVVQAGTYSIPDDIVAIGKAKAAELVQALKRQGPALPPPPVGLIEQMRPSGEMAIRLRSDKPHLNAESIRKVLDRDPALIEELTRKLSEKKPKE